jgi:predicted transcriptional regulator
MSKRTMTLNLSDAEMDAIEELCERKQLTKTALLRQCLRVYQVIEARLDAGEKIFFEDKKKAKSELMLL